MHDGNDRNFEKILKKMEIANTVPKDIEKRIVKSERSNYIKLLKKTGQFSFFTAISAYLMFFLKNLGLTLSAAKGTALILVSSVTITVGIGTGVYLAVDNLAEDKPVVEEITQDKAVSIEAEKAKPKTQEIVKQEKNIVIKKPIIVIESFKSNSVSAKQLTNINRKLKKGLIALRGRSSIVNSIPKGNEYVVLRGYIELSENHYILDIKIYDVKKLEYIYFTSQKAADKNELNYLCEKIAYEINQKFN